MWFHYTKVNTNDMFKQTVIKIYIYQTLFDELKQTKTPVEYYER